MGGKWLISEENLDLIRVYIFCSGDTVDEDLQDNLNMMVEDQDSSDVVKHLRENLVEVHFKMHTKIQHNLVNFLQPLLHIPKGDKSHW